MGTAKGYEPKRPNHWERIEGSPLAGAYLSELFWLARDSRETCERIFTDAQPPLTPDSSYIRVNHQLQAEIYRVLNNSARLRALIKDRPKRKQQSHAQFAVQQERTRWLRNALDGLTLAEVLHAKVRNTLEHFDEYLDATGLRFSTNYPGGTVLLPLDMTLGRDGTLDQFTEGGSVYPLRIYLAEERVFVNCGERINLGTVAYECEAVERRLTALAPHLALEEAATAQERGSSMIVLTDASFN